MIPEIGPRVMEVFDAIGKIENIANKTEKTHRDRTNLVAQQAFLGVGSLDIVAKMVLPPCNFTVFCSITVAGINILRKFTNIRAQIGNHMENGEKITAFQVANECLAFVGATAAGFSTVANGAKRFTNNSHSHERCEKIVKIMDPMVKTTIAGRIAIYLIDQGPNVYQKVKQYLQMEKQKQMDVLAEPLLKGKRELVDFYGDEHWQLTLEEVLKLSKAVKNLEEITEISKLLESTQMFPFKCMITGKKIRFPFSPNFLDLERTKEESRIMYEKKAILDHIEKQPNVAPPGWPVAKLPLPLSLDSVMRNEIIEASNDGFLLEAIEILVNLYPDALKKDVTSA